MKTWKVTTDDFSTVENMVRRGEAIKIGIDWLKTIVNWKWYYYAKKLGMAVEEYLDLRNQIQVLKKELEQETKDYKPRTLNARNHNQIKL